MILIFNELSLRQKADLLQDAYDALENFVMAFVKARSVGFDEIRLYEESVNNLYNITLHEEFSIDRWLSDDRVNYDVRDKFREIVTTSPLISISEIKEIEIYTRSEFYKTLRDEKYQLWGLGVAYIFDTLSVSIANSSHWKVNLLEIEHYYLDHNLQETSENVKVKHFYSIESLDSHSEWWEKIKNEHLKKSIELWNKRQEFFQNLDFCDDVEKQLERIGVSKTLYLIIERLRTLDKYVNNWSEGNFDYEDVNQKTNLRISPESKTTIAKYGSQRKFKIPGQGKKLFDLHIKTSDLRIHFYPDNNNRRIFIGYIGKHLRIASED